MSWLLLVSGVDSPEVPSGALCGLTSRLQLDELLVIPARLYDGRREFSVTETSLEDMPDLPVKIMVNVRTPERSFELSRLSHKGIGLARLESIINRQI